MGGWSSLFSWSDRERSVLLAIGRRSRRRGRAVTAAAHRQTVALVQERRRIGSQICLAVCRVRVAVDLRRGSAQDHRRRQGEPPENLRLRAAGFPTFVGHAGQKCASRSPARARRARLSVSPILIRDDI